MNRLLICTQEMDTKSSTLGFMVRWVTKLAAKYDSIVVVCLKKGDFDLPANVEVVSLGKESADTNNKVLLRIKYIFNFYKAILSNRNKYDKVFVHMNDEYALLGGPVWKLLGKKVFMWRNHYSGSWKTDLVGKFFLHKVFYTSQFSYTANKNKFPQGVQMPVGVDIESLETSEHFEVPENSILALARLDPSKRPEIILQALKKIDETHTHFTMDFVGGTSKDKWPNYEEEIKKLKSDLGLGDQVRFVGAVPSTETYKYYLSHDIYVNVSQSGMLDKTIFKALAAGCLPLTTSVDFNEMISGVVGDEFMVEQDNIDSLYTKLLHVLSLDKEHKLHKVKLMQDVVLNKHSLNTLVEQIHNQV